MEGCKFDSSESGQGEVESYFKCYNEHLGSMMWGISWLSERVLASLEKYVILHKVQKYLAGGI